MSCWAASRRTRGVTYAPAFKSEEPAPGVPGSAALGAGVLASGAAGAAGAGGAGAAVGAGVLAPMEIRAISAPTSTVASVSAAIAASVPDTGAGISVSTLSVEISTSGSSASTASPTDFNQRVMTPSVTLSPSAGRTTETSEPLDTGSGMAGPGVAGPGVAGSGVAGSEGAASAGAAGSAGVSATTGSDGSDGSLEGTAAASSGSPMTASTPPTSTVSSSVASMLSSTPDAGAGISVSTLSVETSRSGSSAATVSPTAFNHRVIVPSVTLSPSCGMVTVTGMRAPCGCVKCDQACACRGFPARARCASPIASFCVGCAWMRDATSVGWASQLTISCASPTCSPRRDPTM